jgi:hypothetical protein
MDQLFKSMKPSFRPNILKGNADPVWAGILIKSKRSDIDHQSATTPVESVLFGTIPEYFLALEVFPAVSIGPGSRSRIGLAQGHLLI